MKAIVMRGMAELEGTAEEIVRALQLLGTSEAKHIGSKPSGPQLSPASVNEATAYVSVSVARTVLKRRPLSKETKTVLRNLYAAYPDTVPATDLATSIGYTLAQLSGLMGAVGRRVSHTPGYVTRTKFFTQSWDSNLNCNRY